MKHTPPEPQGCETEWWIIYGLLTTILFLVGVGKILYNKKEEISAEFMSFLLSWKNVKNGD